MIIDDFSDSSGLSALGTRWRGVSDRVMGGVSMELVEHDCLAGRPCLRLTGTVRTDNNGGFIQASLDLAHHPATLDASSFSGIELLALGNDTNYSIHLRTPDNLRPWQSYRASFHATPHWTEIRLPFDAFVPHRVQARFDTTRLRRIGLVAIGRPFQADVALARLCLYRQRDSGNASEMAGQQ